jgi:GNAT superfamily N-acetyltransferase
MVTIREFEPRDAQAVSSVIRHTMAVSNIDDYAIERLQPLMNYFSPEKVLLLSHERLCLVAEDHGQDEAVGEENDEENDEEKDKAQVVGTIALEGAELCTFFILPEYQGLGIGSQLLTAIETMALAAGIAAIHMDASLTGVAFYEKRGYQRTGVDVEGTAGMQVGMVKRLDR